MDYKKIHDNIIERAKNRKVEGYIEKHHIIPKCMGGSDDEDNLVELTAREHFLVHRLLCEIYPDNYGLRVAYHLMATQSNKRNISNRVYDRLRRKMSVMTKHWIETNGNPMEGKNHSDETKKRMSKYKKEYYKYNKHPWVGRKHKKETLDKLRKKVIHIDSGKVFSSTYEAADYFGLNQCTVSRHCNGKRQKENTKFKFLT